MSTFADLTFPTPKTITGGCLCNAIRYKVDFPPDHDFKKSSDTCQCTLCRRQTGSLFFTAHTIPNSAFTFTSSESSPPNTDPPTLKIYKASQWGDRAFCSTCGSFLYWKSTDPYDGTMGLAVGSIDPLYLFGKGAEDGSKGFGLALAGGGGYHAWCGNEIPGVTDGIGILGCDGRGNRAVRN